MTQKHIQDKKISLTRDYSDLIKILIRKKVNNEKEKNDLNQIFSSV